MWAVVELGLGFVATIVLLSALQASHSSNIRMGAGLLDGVFLDNLALPSDLDFPHRPAEGGCSREIKRLLLLGRKPWNDNVDSVLENRDIALLTKVRLVKVIVFPVVMYGCESWTIRKAECRRINAFKLWCWRRLLRVPWTSRRENQSTPKEINPEYSLEGLMLKLKL